jgi:hypothetical protein
MLNGTVPTGSRYFAVEVVDAETGRGVPLVELTTTHNVRYVTDSAGFAAVDEPELNGLDAFFHVKSHGYEHPANGFGFRGTRLRVVPGGVVRLELRRVNIAERLYRVTGAGIYRDSVLLGRPTPLRQPLLNGEVTGQDTVIMTPYRGRLYWFWGDTNRVTYPLGQFATSGAVSELPEKGGLDAEVGVDLNYFVGKDGFSKRMVPLDEPGLVWIDWIATLPDETGRERLLAKYTRVKNLGENYEHALAVYNDEHEEFEKVKTLNIPLSEPHRSTHPLRVVADGKEMLYLTSGFRFQRVPASLDRIGDIASYESFTCLKTGSEYDPKCPNLDRDANDALQWGWKVNTAAISFRRQQELTERGFIRPDEAWIRLTDFRTGAPIAATPGSIYWNAHRRRWTLIAEQLAGDIWYAEADTPTGPWVYATRVVQHDRYTFYNPTQHPVFNRDGGRRIYFEGTYTSSFSGNPDKTPRYDYNQIMYGLNLDDPRLWMPVAVYRVKDGTLGLREDVDPSNVAACPFFAMAPNRSPEGLVALRDGNGRVVGYILPSPPGDRADTLPVYVASDGRYVTENVNDGVLVGYAWRNPVPFGALDWSVRHSDETFHCGP